jgi:hypothetical protein
MRVGLEEPVCYNGTMTKDQVKEILDRVLNWPPERQADIAHTVELMEAQDRSDLQLTDEQLAEVRRRRAKRNPKYIALAEARGRFGL